MPVNLPMEVLRSFAAIVDSGSMLKAADHVGLTQSAVSLQIKRLEEILQAGLFSRDGRRLALTSTGETLLRFARELLILNDRAVVALTGDALAGPIRIGFVQDFTETLLSGVLSQFAILNPEAQLQVRVGKSPDLLGMMKSDHLDIALCMGAEGEPGSVRVTQMIWLGDEKLAERDILPMAILEQPCRFRETALAALDAAGHPYRVVLETPSLSALRAAVASGLAVTCRTEMFRQAEIPRISSGLPELPNVAYLLRRCHAPLPAVARLSKLIEHAVSELQESTLQ